MNNSDYFPGNIFKADLPLSSQSATWPAIFHRPLRRPVLVSNLQIIRIGCTLCLALTAAARAAPRTLSDQKYFQSRQTLSETCNAAVRNKAQLVINQQWQINSAVCPANVSFGRTGSITYTGSVSFAGSVQATPGTHFIRQGAASLIFTDTSRPFSFSWWGAVADASDQTKHFQDAIDSVHSSGGGTITVPSLPNCYMVSSLKYYSNLTISGENRAACIQQLGGSQHAATNPGGDSVFYGDATTPVTNVHFRNFTIDGNRANISGISGDGGKFGIIFFGASNSSVDDMTIANAYTDGITIDGAGQSLATMGTGVSISHTIVTRSRRNNISVVAGLNTIIKNCELSYASGTNPEAGIDVEQYQAGAYVNGLQIIDSEIHHNAADGVLLNLKDQDDPDLAVTITNVNSHDNGMAGLHAVNFTRFGKLIVRGGVYSDNHGCCAISLAGWTQVTINGETTYGSSRGILLAAHNPSVLLGPGSISGITYDLSVDGPDSQATLNGATLVHNIIQPGEEHRVNKIAPVP